MPPGRPELATEVVQTIRTAIVYSLLAYRRQLIRTAIDYVRRQAPDQEELSDNLAEPETDGPDEKEIQYSGAQIKEATKKLPAGYRIILSLYLFEGYDMEEIASILKIQPPSVRSQYLRAKRKLLDIIAAN